MIKLIALLFIGVNITLYILAPNVNFSVNTKFANQQESELIEHVEINQEDLLDNPNDSSEGETAASISKENDQQTSLEKEEGADEVLNEIVDSESSNPANQSSQITDTHQTDTSIELQVKQKANPSDYSELISYTGFSDIEIKLINNILKIYNAHKNDNEEYYSEDIDYVPSYQNYQNVMSFFHIYYGMSTEIYDVVFDFQIHGNEYTTIRLYMNNMRKFEKERDDNTKHIQNIIATFDNGTEKELVTQAAKYIADRTTYTKNYYNISDILNGGQGVCNAYALTLTRFCQMLGIKNDLCFGYALGGFHVWNKVTYSDGTVEYFDITFFDSGNQNKYKYFNMKSSPHTIDTINLYYY